MTRQQSHDDSTGSDGHRTDASKDPSEGMDSDATSGDRTEKVLLETTPTLRPTLLLMGVTFVVGLVLVGYLVANPETVAGDPGLTEIVWNVIGIIVALILARLAVRLFILTRTTYVVRTDALRREFTLLYRHRSREIPINQLRGHELSQNRFQMVFGFGSIRLLTGGTNQSLGFIEFEDLPEPHRTRSQIQRALDRSE